MTESAKHPVVLIILDGWGHRQATDDNAIAGADSPTWDRLWREAPHTLISGSGLDVGLPEGQMGNSEVGHMSLGAGRIVPQTSRASTRPSRTAASMTTRCTRRRSAPSVAAATCLHLIGLLSPAACTATSVCSPPCAWIAALARAGLPPRLPRRARHPPAQARTMQPHAVWRRSAAAGIATLCRSLLRHGSRPALGAAGESLPPAHRRRCRPPGGQRNSRPGGRLRAGSDDEFVAPTVIAGDGGTRRDRGWRLCCS